MHVTHVPCFSSRARALLRFPQQHISFSSALKPGTRDRVAQEKLLHHQASPSPGKAVLCARSREAPKLACAISVPWNALGAVTGGVQESNEARVTGRCGQKPHTALPTMRPGSAVFLTPPYLVKRSHSSPETNPPKNPKCWSRPLGWQFGAG